MPSLQLVLQLFGACSNCAKELGSTFCNDCMDFFIGCKLQLAIATCNVSSATYNRFLFPTLPDKLAEKLPRIAIADVDYAVDSLATLDYVDSI